MKKSPVLLLILTTALTLPTLALPAGAMERRCTTQQSEGGFTTSLSRPCTGDEEIIITINFNVTARQCVDQDGRVTTRFHFRYHGTGVGSTTGNEYVLNAQEKDMVTVTPTCEFSSARTFYQELISKGPQPNVRLINEATFTVDSDCQVSSSQEFEIICRG